MSHEKRNNAFNERSEPTEEAEWKTITQNENPLLSVHDLETRFETEDGTVHAVDGVSFEIEQGEILGIVGESGSGKSATSLSLMRLIQDPGYLHGGEIMFDGQNLTNLSNDDMRKIRGDRISMIFQEPMAALNPVFDIGWQVGEPLRVHQEMKEKASRQRAVELLRQVGVPSPEDRVDDYPHEFSGGMRQRAVIAMALASEPELLIADEPTTKLDVTVQAQILDLIQQLNNEIGMSVLLVTHNLGVVAEVCDRVAVMYAGRIVEYADVETLFSDPRHPYTQGLLDCISDPRQDSQDIQPIEGEVPNLTNTPSGCNFEPRCPNAISECQQIDPRLREVDDDHYSACIWRDP